MRIAMIGTGYVGLVSGACFSEFGVDVICVDKDAEKIKTLSAGGIPIYEPGLEELVKRNSEEERLVFTTEKEKAVQDALVIFLALYVGACKSSGPKMDAPPPQPTPVPTPTPVPVIERPTPTVPPLVVSPE